MRLRSAMSKIQSTQCFKEKNVSKSSTQSSYYSQYNNNEEEYDDDDSTSPFDFWN